jgi:hypothetical protein
VTSFDILLYRTVFTTDVTVTFIVLIASAIDTRVLFHLVD